LLPSNSGCNVVRRHIFIRLRPMLIYMREFQPSTEAFAVVARDVEIDACTNNPLHADV
jgi:hypothetical protein